MKKYKLVLDDGLMAYFLLTAANLSHYHERLVRATASLNSDDIKDKLQKVFGEFDGNDVDMQIGTLPVKEECLFTKGYNRQGSNRGGHSCHRGWSQQNSCRGFGKNQDSGQRGDQCSSQRVDYIYNRSQRRLSVGRSKSQHNSNPFDAEGNIMQCHECDSTKHFLNDCPHRHVEGAEMAIHVTLIAGSVSKEQDVMLKESLARGILDSACTRRVAGKIWTDEYVYMLTNWQREEILKSAKSEFVSVQIW